MTTSIITGCTGQDGSYLSELLLKEGHNVVGVSRRVSTSNTARIDHLFSNERFKIREGDVADSGSVYSFVEEYRPKYFFNLAAQSHVGTSFDQPYYTTQVNYVGVLNCLEAIRRFSPQTRFYQASTSEMFGDNVSHMDSLIFPKREGLAGTSDHYIKRENYQDENTPYSPMSPYAVSKTAAHYLVNNYRKAYGIHASCGILFNHESSRRGDKFVTQKIVQWVRRFLNWVGKSGVDPTYIFDCHDDFITHPLTGQTFPKLRLGNLDACRDWGHAKDYCEAMLLMVRQDSPDDYVIATGDSYSVRDFLDIVFKEVEIEDWSEYVVVDPKFFRPSEVPYLRGVSTKARHKLGWKPKHSFEDLVKEMLWGVEAVAKETTN